MIGKLKIEKIEDLYDYLWNAARDIIATKQEHMPLLMLFPEVGEPVFIPIARMEQELVSFLQMEGARRAGMRCAVMVAEAYMAKVKLTNLDEILEKASTEGLKEVAGVEEVVHFNFRTAGRQAVMYCRIDRESGTLEKVPFRWLDTEGVGFSH